MAIVSRALRPAIRASMMEMSATKEYSLNEDALDAPTKRGLRTSIGKNVWGITKLDLAFRNLL